MIDPQLQQLVNALTCMPSIGNKSAQRIALHLLERNRESAMQLGDVLIKSMQTIHHCQQCRNYTSEQYCLICQDERRDKQVICVVETPADMMAIEQAGVFKGCYFILMGRLSPLDGLGPDELGIDQLIEQLQKNNCQELIVATSATAEGEATAFYLSEVARKYQINISRIAHGIPMGGELEYIDQDTLMHALSRREMMNT